MPSSSYDLQQLIKNPDRLFIGGRWVKPSNEGHIEVVNPSTEETFLRVAEARETDIAAAVAAAREAFDTGPWPRMSHEERAVYLRALGQKLRERAGDVSQIWPREMGVLHSIAAAFSGGMGGVFDFYAYLAAKFPFAQRLRRSPAVTLGHRGAQHVSQ